MGIISLENEDVNLKNIWMIEGVGLSSNIYILGNFKITVIDTGIGNNLNRISSHLNEISLDMSNINNVILTHNHTDHISGIKEILEYTKPVVYVHRNDSNIISSPNFPYKLLKGGEVINANLPLKIIHTPGHTKGSICLYHKETKSLFSGDTVFPYGSFGRTNLFGGNLKQMISTLEKLTKLPVKNLLPGHYYPVFKDGSSHIKKAYLAAKSLLNEKKVYN